MVRKEGLVDAKIVHIIHQLEVDPQAHPGYTWQNNDSTIKDVFFWFKILHI